MVSTFHIFNSSKFTADAVSYPNFSANDGLIEIFGIDQLPTLKEVFKSLFVDKKGGLTYYDKGKDGWRGRKIKVTQRGIRGAMKPF